MSGRSAPERRRGRGAVRVRNMRVAVDRCRRSAAGSTGARRVRGTVTSMSDHALTITRASHRGDVLVFTLDESTVRSGVIAVGVMVSVRYRYEGSLRFAIAVNGPPAPAEPR